MLVLYVYRVLPSLGIIPIHPWSTCGERDHAHFQTNVPAGSGEGRRESPEALVSSLPFVHSTYLLSSSRSQAFPFGLSSEPQNEEGQLSEMHPFFLVCHVKRLTKLAGCRPSASPSALCTWNTHWVNVIKYGNSRLWEPLVVTVLLLLRNLTFLFFKNSAYKIMWY